MLKILVLFAFCSLNFSSFSQSEVNKIVTDLNNDKIQDTILFHEYYVKVYNSISNETYRIAGQRGYNYGSQANLIEIIPIPEALVTPENKSILDTITQYLLPNFTTPDPSLDWIIKGYQSRIIDTSNQYFHFTLNVPPDYKYDTLEYPDASYKMISKKSLPVFWELNINEAYKDYKYGVLVYYGHNHLYRNNKYQSDTIIDNIHYYLTAHGIFAKKDGKYSWIFISNSTLTGGPEKLRWHSIVDFKIKDNLMIIHHMHGVGLNNFIVLNLNNGKSGLLKIEDDYFGFNHFKCIDIEFSGTSLLLHSWRTEDCYYDKGDQETLTFNLKTLEQELQ